MRNQVRTVTGCTRTTVGHIEWCHQCCFSTGMVDQQLRMLNKLIGAPRVHCCGILTVSPK
jgi:hypothetical protein